MIIGTGIGEIIFQSPKKYENGGPYRDMLDMSPKDAKRDQRHHNSGKKCSAFKSAAFGVRGAFRHSKRREEFENFYKRVGADV